MNNKIVSSYSNETNNLRNRNQLQNNNNNNIETNINHRIKEISIQYKCCTPYFKFGKVIFFYCPCSLNNLKISNEYYTNVFDLYKMPDPPFAIGDKCKYFLLIFISKTKHFYLHLYVYSF